MNAQIETYTSALKVVTDRVTRWEAAKQHVKGRGEPVKGYALMSDTRVLALIETTQPHSRIEELLDQYTLNLQAVDARKLMRDLLNAEDYRSTIYDVIVRIYYAEDFA